MIFFYLNGWELARQRVEQRVSKGGHDIPEVDIKRRYYRGIENLPGYMEIVDDWYLYDNSGGEYLPIAKKVHKDKIIINFERWKEIIKNE